MNQAVTLYAGSPLAQAHTMHKPAAHPTRLSLIRHRIAGFVPLAGLLAALLLSGGAAQAQGKECAKVSPETCKLAAQLGRGINLGDLYDPPNEGDWGQRMRPEFIEVAAKHFKTVRLTVRWSNHADLEAHANLDGPFAKRVDQTIDSLLAAGLNVIVDVHHYNQLYGSGLAPGEFRVADNVVEVRYLNIWRQLAERYKAKPPNLIFELLNEPHDRLEGEAWNQLMVKALQVVRQSNPQRTVMVSPGSWGHPRGLAQLRLPADRNLIVGVHSYDPFFFTHQGASWLPSKPPVGVSCCSPLRPPRPLPRLSRPGSGASKTAYRFTSVSLEPSNLPPWPHAPRGPASCAMLPRSAAWAGLTGAWSAALAPGTKTCAAGMSRCARPCWISKPRARSCGPAGPCCCA